MRAALLALGLLAASAHALWPQPKAVTFSGAVGVTDSTQFAFSVASGSSDVLQRAITRYGKLTFIQKLLPNETTSAAQWGSALSGMSITVKDPNQPLVMLVDESYELAVPASGTVTLTAQTTWGALRGLERFTQLVSWTGQGSMFYVQAASIQDAPRFSHRGVLLDTSRHFLDVQAIYASLDAMAYNFLSVFHWHIVDDQSFPYDSTTYPELSEMGAYNAPATSHRYSQEDVANIIAFARDRGIRVLVEFDTPGHTESWGISHPELLVPCYSNGKPNGERYGMNPLLNSTFTFMANLYAEIKRVFPDQYVHVGGDELILGPDSCWASNPDILAYMKAHGWTDLAKMENVYEQRLVDIVNGLGLRAIGWQELFDNGLELEPSFVVNVWKSTGWAPEMERVTAAGYQTVLSALWYENYIANPYATSGDWESYYTAEPLAFNGTAAQKAKVIGCEGSFWAEYIDATNLFSRAWPRMSAAAERFWSPATVNDPEAAMPRLHRVRCSLMNRGIAAEPVLGPSFCPTPFDMNYQAPY